MALWFGSICFYPANRSGWREFAADPNISSSRFFPYVDTIMGYADWAEWSPKTSRHADSIDGLERTRGSVHGLSMPTPTVPHAERRTAHHRPLGSAGRLRVAMGFQARTNRRRQRQVRLRNPINSVGLLHRRITIAENMQKGPGYAHGCIGKWHRGYRNLSTLTHDAAPARLL